MIFGHTARPWVFSLWSRCGGFVQHERVPGLLSAAPAWAAPLVGRFPPFWDRRERAPACSERTLCLPSLLPIAGCCTLRARHTQAVLSSQIAVRCILTRPVYACSLAHVPVLACLSAVTPCLSDTCSRTCSLPVLAGAARGSLQVHSKGVLQVWRLLPVRVGRASSG